MSCVWMLQRGHSGDGCVLASTLCKYDLRKGDLFVLSWARVRRVRRGRISSVPKISAYSWWNCQATHNRLQIEINYYPDSLLFVSTGFLPRVSSQWLN